MSDRWLWIFRLVSLVCLIAFFLTAMNVLRISKEQSTSLLGSLEIHLEEKRNAIGITPPDVRGALGYTLSPEPPFFVGTQPQLVFSSVDGNFRTPIVITVKPVADTGVVVSSDEVELRFDPRTGNSIAHHPLIVAADSPGEKRLIVTLREARPAPSARRPRVDTMVIPIKFVEASGFWDVLKLRSEGIRNLSAAIGLPSLFILWLNWRRRPRTPKDWQAPSVKRSNDSKSKNRPKK